MRTARAVRPWPRACFNWSSRVKLARSSHYHLPISEGRRKLLWGDVFVIHNLKTYFEVILLCITENITSKQVPTLSTTRKMVARRSLYASAYAEGWWRLTTNRTMAPPFMDYNVVTAVEFCPTRKGTVALSVHAIAAVLVVLVIH